jgi:hypothetical protein
MAGWDVNVFISYRHSDNASGWITVLHKYLEERIIQLLGVRDACIWRDPKLHGGDALWETIEPKVVASAVFISILSPGYLESDACLREARWFCQAAAARGGMLVENTCRFIRVVKTPFPPERLPDDLRTIETIEYRLFREIPQSGGRFREFPADPTLPDHNEFQDKAEDLAQSIVQLLQKMRRKFNTQEGGKRPTVFLAEATSDRSADRSFIAAEIAGACDILPATPLPSTVEELTKRLAGDLRECVLSVHILGSRFGMLPEGEETRSVPQIQIEQAAAVRRLIWIPEDLAGLDERFRKQIESCRDERMEVVESGRQAFVQHLRDVLAELSKPRESAVSGKAIYLVSAEKDLVRLQLRQIRNYLLQEGIRVEQPVFEGDDPGELRKAEERAVRDSNAAIIYYGNAPDAWVRIRRMEILKALAFTETASAYRRAIYLCSPETPYKSAVYMGLPGGQLPEPCGLPLLILGDCGEFSCSKLAPLLQHIARAANA